MATYNLITLKELTDSNQWSQVRWFLCKSFPGAFAHPLTHSLTSSYTHSLVHSLTYSSHSVFLSLTHSLTHFLLYLSFPLPSPPPSSSPSLSPLPRPSSPHPLSLSFSVQFNWTEFAVEMFKKAKVTVDPDLTVLVKTPSFFRKLTHLYSYTHAR